MKTYQIKKSRQEAAYIVCCDNVIQHPKELSQVPIWWNTYKYSLTSGFPDHHGKGEIPGHIFVTICF